MKPTTQTHFTDDYIFPKEDKPKYIKEKKWDEKTGNKKPRQEKVKNKISASMKVKWAKRKQERENEEKINNGEEGRSWIYSICKNE